MVEVFELATAPSYAKHSSTFKTDPSCVEVFFFIGDDWDEVYLKTKTVAQSSIRYVDYDVNWSNEGEKFVGIVVEDS